MNTVKTYKSDAFAAIHKTMSGMYDAGVIDKKTMHRFDEACLTPVHAFTATEIKALREREEVSQSVFLTSYSCRPNSPGKPIKSRGHFVFALVVPNESFRLLFMLLFCIFLS